MQVNRLNNKTIALITQSVDITKDFSDGNNLILRAKSGNFTWVYRYKKNGQTRRLGLGRFHNVTLKRARIKAQELNTLRATGVDLRIHLHEKKTAQRKDRLNTKTVQQVCLEFLEKNIARNCKRTLDGKSSKLRNYVYPHLGKQLIADVKILHIQQVLNPIWQRIPSSAKTLQRLLERVFAYAKIQGYYQHENPAVWQNQLDQVLPIASSLYVEKRHRSCNWTETPQLMADIVRYYDNLDIKLRYENSSLECLQFLLLNVSRSVEARGATWTEIDWENETWTIPKNRLKTRRQDHVVYLSKQSMKLLHCVKASNYNPVYVFPATYKNVIMQANRLTMALKHIHWHKKTSVHGLRSCFKTWVDHQRDFEWDYQRQKDIRELCLSHTIESKVENSYTQDESGQYLAEDRRILTQRWADFIMPEG